MQLVICDFDGTIYLEETPRLFLNVLARHPGKRNQVKAFYLSLSWLYLLYKLGLCRELLRRRTVDGIANILKGMDQTKLDEFLILASRWPKKGLIPKSSDGLNTISSPALKFCFCRGPFPPFWLWSPKNSVSNTGSARNWN